MILKACFGVMLLIWLVTGLTMVGRMIHEMDTTQGPISRIWIAWCYAYAMVGIMVSSLSKWLL